MGTRDNANAPGSAGAHHHDRTAGAPEAADTEPELRNVGLKVTLPRKRVLEIFRSSPSSHLSAEEVYRQLLDQHHDVGMATVYRVLSQLEAAGLLLRHVFDGGRALYEYNEGTHHDHLICLNCGRVDEFTDDKIEALQQVIAKAHGYRLTDHRLALFGVCPECQSN